MPNRNDKTSLFDFRSSIGLSQEEAARRSLVSLNTWKNWEAGRACPNVRKYGDIANALSITIEQVQDAVRIIEQQMLSREVA